MVGRKTVEIDNPSLTTREVNGPNPIRLVIDPNLKLKKEYNVQYIVYDNDNGNDELFFKTASTDRLNTIYANPKINIYDIKG